LPPKRADGTSQSDGRCENRKPAATPTKCSLRVLDSRKIQQGSQRLLEAGTGGGHRNHPGRGLVPRCGVRRPLPNNPIFSSLFEKALPFARLRGGEGGACPRRGRVPPQEPHSVLQFKKLHSTMLDCKAIVLVSRKRETAIKTVSTLSSFRRKHERR